MKNMKQKIAEIITSTHKTPLEQADEILLLFSGSNKEERVAVCNCPGTKITNPAIIYICSKCDKPIDFEWQLETDC